MPKRTELSRGHLWFLFLSWVEPCKFCQWVQDLIAKYNYRCVAHWTNALDVIVGDERCRQRACLV